MKIVVLAGGTSTERDVSLSTGKLVYKALKENGHQAVLLDVYLGYEGEDYAEVFEQEHDWAKEIGAVSETAPDLSTIKALRQDGGTSFFGPGVLEICGICDIVFMALHGANGEDGKVQAALDLFGIKYTGSGYIGAALTMDKAISKDFFALHNIPTPKGITLTRQEWERGQNKKQQVPYPAMVKTCCGGSSVGVYLAKDESEYEGVLKEAFTYEERVVVEQYIRGREFSVGVIEGKALPIIEIAPFQGFYNYKNKYQAGSAVETCPADLEKETTEKMQRIAEQVFEVLKLTTYARMDFMLNEDYEIFCLEANTLPGMTPTSLLPQEAQAVGMNYNQLCEEIIRISLKKYE